MPYELKTQRFKGSNGRNVVTQTKHWVPDRKQKSEDKPSFKKPVGKTMNSHIIPEVGKKYIMSKNMGLSHGSRTIEGTCIAIKGEWLVLDYDKKLRESKYIMGEITPTEDKIIAFIKNFFLELFGIKKKITVSDKPDNSEEHY